jgi:hypothetical protein
MEEKDSVAHIEQNNRQRLLADMEKFIVRSFVFIYIYYLFVYL